MPSEIRPRIVPMQPAPSYSEMSRSGLPAFACAIRPWKPASVSSLPPLIDVYSMPTLSSEAGQRGFGAVRSGVVGADDADRLRVELLLGDAGHAGGERGVAAGHEQRIGRVVARQDGQQPDHGEARRLERGVAREEIEPEQHEFDVGAGDLLGTRLRGLRRALRGTGDEFEWAAAVAAVLVEVGERRLGVLADLGEVEAGHAFGVDHADHQRLARGGPHAGHA